MRLTTFFYQYPVFTLAEFSNFLSQQGQTHKPNQMALLAYHKQQGHIVSIRRRLFAVVPPLKKPENLQIDPYLIAGRITGDAVIAYHSALELHGLAYSVFYSFYFISQQQIKPFTFQNQQFKCLKSSIAETGQLGIKVMERQGLDIKVTSIECTLVDVLDKPELGGGYEEVWRSLEAIAVLNIEQVITYALAIGNATTIAKVGYFLEQHQDLLMVEQQQLERLAQYIPRGKHYFDNTRREAGFYSKRWHLVVPKAIGNKQWEEPSDTV